MVPITGVIGEESFNSGLERALKHAMQKRIARVVLDIDTPGGLVDEASAMAKAIAAHREAMAKSGLKAEFIALVRNAISAGIWLALSCEQMFIVEGGVIGGAVAFSVDHTTGAAEVDAKMNSIYAAEVSALADRHGYPAAVVKAMMIMSEQCWAWTDAEGRWRVEAEKPRENADKAWKVDGAATVLTLRSGEAERLGMARVVGTPDAQALGPALGLEGWKSAGDAGGDAMAWAKGQAEKDLARAKKQVEEIRDLRQEISTINDTLLPRAFERANNAHPHNWRYTVFRDTGNFTPESRQDWVRRTDEALAAWEDVQNGMRKLDRLDKRHEQLTGEPYFNRTQARFVAKDIDKVISDLRTNRNRASPP